MQLPFPDQLLVVNESFIHQQMKFRNQITGQAETKHYHGAAIERSPFSPHKDSRDCDCIHHTVLYPSTAMDQYQDCILITFMQHEPEDAIFDSVFVFPIAMFQFIHAIAVVNNRRGREGNCHERSDDQLPPPFTSLLLLSIMSNYPLDTFKQTQTWRNSMAHTTK